MSIDELSEKIPDKLYNAEYTGAEAFPASSCSPCECNSWANVNWPHRMLTGHHENCPKSPDPLAKALELIADLAKGMDCWAADEDGIHPDAWEAFKKAKVVGGDLSVLKEENS